MFGFGRKKKNSTPLVAPVSGELKDLSMVDDPVFSKGTMGKGFAVAPSTNTVVSPVSGDLMMVFPTGHAFAVKTEDGAEVLVHIGIDTVELKGEGFTSLKAQGDSVSAGEPVVEFDWSISDNPQVKAMDVLVVVTNSKDFDFERVASAGSTIGAGEKVLDLYKAS